MRARSRRASLGGEDLDPGRGQLDGQREPVEAGADLGDGGRVVVGHRKPGLDGRGSLDEQGHGLELRQPLDRGEMLGVGEPEGWNRVLALPVEAEGFPAGGQDPDLLGGRQQLADLAGGLQHLLEVVQDQEQVLVPKVVDDRLDRRAVGGLPKPQGLGYRGKDQGGVGDRGQGHEECPVLRLGQQLGGRPERQPGLAGSPRAGESQKATVAEPLLNLLQLPPASHETGELDREVVRAGIHRPEGLELGRQPVGHHLEDPLRPGQVLQPVLAEIPERDALGSRRLDQGSGGRGGHDLSPVAGSGDPGRPVHIDAHVVVRTEYGLPGVKSDPHPDLLLVRPGVTGQGPLGLDGGGHRLGRGGEHHEERVALRRHLHTAPPGERFPEEPLVILQDSGIPVAQAIEEPGAPLDVGEHEGDRSGGKIGPGRPHARLLVERAGPLCGPSEPRPLPVPTHGGILPRQRSPARHSYAAVRRGACPSVDGMSRRSPRPPDRGPVVALVAHDTKKDDLLRLVEEHLPLFARFHLLATGTTGTLLAQELGLPIERMAGGPEGGDLQIGARIAQGEVDALIFLRDPLTSHPHEPDIQALVKVCDVHEVAVATNLASAEALLLSLDQRHGRMRLVHPSLGIRNG